MDAGDALRENTFHPDIAERLLCLARRGADHLPHLVVYGPPGSGKHTLIRGLLRALFPSNAHPTSSWRSIRVPNKGSIRLHCIESDNTLECNPSVLGTQDRVVTQGLMKDLAQDVPLLARVEELPFRGE